MKSLLVGMLYILSGIVFQHLFGIENPAFYAFVYFFVGFFAYPYIMGERA